MHRTPRRRFVSPLSVQGVQSGAAFKKNLRRRKLVVQFFGCTETVARMRRAMHVGRQKIRQCFELAAAVYNLVRMKNPQPV